MGSRSSGCCAGGISDLRRIAFAAALVGMGSAIFHPESSRGAGCFGGKHGFAQSFFWSAATVVQPWDRCSPSSFCQGKSSIAWFFAGGAAGDDRPRAVGTWSKTHRKMAASPGARIENRRFIFRTVAFSIAILVALIFHSLPGQPQQLPPSTKQISSAFEARSFICSSLWARWRRAR